MVFKIFSSMDYRFTNWIYIKILVWLRGLFFILWASYRFYVLWGGVSVKFEAFVDKFVKNCQSFWFSYSFVFKFFIGWRFLFILNLKLWGMVPYVFGLTSQMFFVLTISIILWLAIFLYGITWGVFKFVSHLVPQGRPLGLAAFLSIVELISKIIRPLTLALRLRIKITTGHIFISLIRRGILGFVLRKSFWGFFIFSSILGFYYIFEFIICGIQAIVFNLLLVQYVEEISI